MLMHGEKFLHFHNGQAFDTAACPVWQGEPFRRAVVDAVAQGARLAALFVREESQSRLLTAILARSAEGMLAVAATPIDASYPALTQSLPAAHWFEREIAEQWGVTPTGHPWLKPIRFQPSRQRAASGGAGAGQPRPGCGVTDFFRLEGEEVHEVAVGPVHAGVIEPGHFRFQCHGETVYHLEISLGYQHRGIERALVGGPNKRTIHYMETAAGDTTIGHAHAYCRAFEALSGCRVPARGQAIRGVAAELERMANHVGDLGALAGDVGFLPTMSYCGRIRGDILNLTAALCGNRFGRGIVVPGGTAVDLDAHLAHDIIGRLGQIERDLATAVELLWTTPSVQARFDGTGRLDAATARQIGLVGVAARACGIEQDVRHDFPYGLYRFAQMPLSTWHTGDVFARAYVRWLEVQRSLAFVVEQLGSMPTGAVCQPAGPLGANMAAVALVEGWRGEICHVAFTGPDGELTNYKIVDPSFHNWFGLAMALRNEPISDFPLNNKSFNLSYCGHDL